MNVPGPENDQVAGQPEDRPKIDRKRLDEIFGEVLPESTSDDRDHGQSSAGRDDTWFTENRPPHHGG